MGFDDGQIELDSENDAYYAGQTINGQIVFNQKKDKTIHGIYVSLKGFCKVHWTTQKSRRVNDRTQYYTVDHTSYEEYVKKKIFIFGNSDGEHDLKAGNHECKFALSIPDNCPSSFEGSDGHIRYRVKAVMVTSGMFSSNKELFRAVRVIAPTNLNDDPYCKEPLEFDLSQTYCCWCFNSGSSELRVKLPAGGYCPGQIIPIEVSCENNSTVDIKQIKLAIKRHIQYIAASEPDTRKEKEIVAEIKKGPVPGSTTRNWTVEMEVPAMDVYNLCHCRYIDVKYSFKVSTKAGVCHTDQDESQPLIIGTVPLDGYQDDVVNPQHDQMPKLVEQVTSYPSPIMNQPFPTSPYPINQPYPNSSPYPTVNAPYPNTPVNQPYPNANPISPYPTDNHNGSPYPPTSQPYPGNTPSQNISPYPPTNPGYPGTPNQNILPYPPANQPGYAPNQNTSPYPQTNQGYPSTPNQNMSPYPQTNQPYPKASLPYPSNSPVPPQRGNTPSPTQPYSDNRAVTSSSLLKTGTIGFMMPSGDAVRTPSLPPGANVPYPLSPANPYASASAPEPATPDSVNDNPAAMSPTAASNPPYNPEFMNEQKKDDK